MKKFSWKNFLICLGVVLVTGGIGYLLSMNSEKVYTALNLPFFAPPIVLFSIVWPILYVLMGVSLYFILQSDSELKKPAIEIFAIQSAINLLWPLSFFILKLYIVGLVVLIALDILVFFMIKIFLNINKLAGWLQLPYLIWTIFATILNFSIVLMN